MKKLLLSAIISIITFTGLSAQDYKFWAGGRMSLWTGSNHTTVIVAPEVGYHLTKKLTLAASVGFHSYSYDDEYYLSSDKSGFVINPYIRYTAFKKGIVLGFIDGGVDFGLGDMTGFQFGLKPGIAILLTDRLTAATQFGFLGYNDGKGIGGRITEGFGLDLSGYCSTIAFFYSF